VITSCIDVVHIVNDSHDPLFPPISQNTPRILISNEKDNIFKTLVRLDL
jgi:hypothetical protein